MPYSDKYYLTKSAFGFGPINGIWEFQIGSEK